MAMRSTKSVYYQRSLIKKNFFVAAFITTTLFYWPGILYGQQTDEFHKRTVVSKTEQWKSGVIDDTRHVVDSFFYNDGTLREITESIIKRKHFHVVDSIPVKERKLWKKGGQLLLSEQFSEGRIIGVKSNYPSSMNMIQNGSFETRIEIPKHKIIKINDPLILCKPSESIIEIDTVHFHSNKDMAESKFILYTKETASNCDNDYSRMVQKYLIIEKNEVIIDSIFVRTTDYIHKGIYPLSNKHHDCNYETVKINVNGWKSLGQAYPNIFDLQNRAPMHPLTGLADSVFYFEPIAGNNFVKLMALQYSRVTCNPWMAHPILQNKLSTTLIKGQKYHLEFWLWKPKTYPESRPLKVYFSQEALTIKNYKEFFMNAFALPAFNDSTVHQWQKVVLTFEAPEFARYMTIGFFDFEKDNIPVLPEDRIERWCYMDGFILVAEDHKDQAIPNFHPELSDLPETLPADDLEDEQRKMLNDHKIEREIPTVLEYVLFEIDSDILLPESLSVLAKLKAILDKYPDISVKICGHSDDTGSEEHNKQLSANRAKAVVLKLIEFGINANRLSWKGFGSTVPLSHNDTEEGRAKNRRVEFVIF
ncbi:MAG TPA: OmpA family protein [Brumimicrobium sp.]|nr:OmpA family protein [Brumimicrobium sp.]